MPKNTFLNLPSTKQEKILQAAITEFAKHTFERASLTRLVEQLGIAKGSMYQYFENKQDLYMFVVKQAYERKHQYLKGVFESEGEFFGIVSDYYRRSYLFSQEQPLLHEVINNFWESKDEDMQEQILASKEMRAMDFQSLLEKGIKQGVIDPDVCTKAAFFVYHSVGKALIDQYQGLISGEVDDHLQFIDNVLAVLMLGLKRR